MICFNAIPDDPAVPAFVVRSAHRRSTSRPTRVPALPKQSGAPRIAIQKLGGEEDIFSARIGLEYRALAVMNKDRIVWYWIGSHSDYDRLV
jgi:hypothetical protein